MTCRSEGRQGLNILLSAKTGKTYRRSVRGGVRVCNKSRHDYEDGNRRHHGGYQQHVHSFGCYAASSANSGNRPPFAGLHAIG
jgi:hypothetical protein